MQTRTVSVVIPTYNHSQYLPQTIASALAQTWRDFEVIVVDDGSTDSSAEVAAQFSDAIRYIRQANRGIADARNTGIMQACGEFISFLDDDDLWEPNYLETVVSIFRQAADTAAVHTGWQNIDQAGTRLPEKSIRTVPPEQLYDRLIVGGFFPGACVTVRKTCLDRVGLFDETLQGCDDLDMWLRISRAHMFRGIPKVLVLYRIHEGGLSSDGLHMFRDRLKVISKHFGPDEGVPHTWAEEKRRAYGFTYRWGALACMEQNQSYAGWEYLRQAIQVLPELLTRLDTFYELACVGQPRGYRGEANLVDIEGNGGEIARWLDSLYRSGTSLTITRKTAYGNAYLALGMLCDQAGHWAKARYYIIQAFKANPNLMTCYPVTRRFLKLCAGQRLVSLGRVASASRQQAARR